MRPDDLRKVSRRTHAALTEHVRVHGGAPAGGREHRPELRHMARARRVPVTDDVRAEPARRRRARRPNLEQPHISTHVAHQLIEERLLEIRDRAGRVRQRNDRARIHDASVAHYGNCA